MAGTGVKVSGPARMPPRSISPLPGRRRAPVASRRAALGRPPGPRARRLIRKSSSARIHRAQRAQLAVAPAPRIRPCRKPPRGDVEAVPSRDLLQPERDSRIPAGYSTFWSRRDVRAAARLRRGSRAAPVALGGAVTRTTSVMPRSAMRSRSRSCRCALRPVAKLLSFGHQSRHATDSGIRDLAARPRKRRSSFLRLRM